MKTAKAWPLIAAIVSTMAAASGVGIAQAPKGTFAWFAELVSFESKTNTLTVKARVEPHVVRYAGTFTPGDRIAIVWTHFKGNADAIRYVTSETALDAQAGYVVRGRFVSVDETARALTFATPLPAASGATLARVRPGTPIRVTGRLVPGAAADQPVAVAVNVSAPPRPARVSQAAGAAREAGGTWTVQTTTGNPIIKLLCTFVQDNNKLAGTCRAEGLGDIKITSGSVDRDVVSFSIDVPMQGAALPMTFRGTLNADGIAITGKAGFLADSLDFDAAKR